MFWFLASSVAWISLCESVKVTGGGKTLQSLEKDHAFMKIKLQI